MQQDLLSSWAETKKKKNNNDQCASMQQECELYPGYLLQKKKKKRVDFANCKSPGRLLVAWEGKIKRSLKNVCMMRSGWWYSWMPPEIKLKKGLDSCNTWAITHEQASYYRSMKWIYPWNIWLVLKVFELGELTMIVFPKFIIEKAGSFFF